jgi:prepilin-type N-terminal cleavage/methylation domain-containing protein
MKSKGHRGFTLIEVMLGLAIAGLLATGLVASLRLLLTQAPESSAKLAVESRHQLARYWLTRDANSAEDFTPGVSPTYGTFTWRDFSGESTNTYLVRYFYDSTIKAVMREEKKNNVTQSTDQIAADILLVGDSTFTWNPGQRKITVAVTPTIQEALTVGDISRTATLVAWLRFEGEALAPVPAP